MEMAGGGEVIGDIDVFWVCRDPEFLTRGYADCGFLEELLDGKVWAWPEDVTFRHHDVRAEFPHHDGSIVCFSGMGNAKDADWLIGEIDKMAWSLVIITGNECWDFPWERLPETATRRVWVMNPTPDHAHLSYRLPGGPYPGTRDMLRDHADLARARPLNWFFGGQVTNTRRRECVAAFGSIGRGRIIKTDRFMGGIPQEEWNELVISAKAIPCPSGPMTVDANRPLAALEAGTVPILDMRKPNDPQFDYWHLVFGNHPLPAVYDWQAEARAAMDRILKGWPHQSNRASAWWQQWKRATYHRLNDDLRAVMPRDRQINASWMLRNRITAIITTSPIPSHPETSILEATIESIRAQLPDAEIIVAFDGVRPEQARLADAYREYVRRVVWKCNWEWTRVLPVVMDGWGHQANTTRYALGFVRTPTILFMEHDTPILGEIDWDGIIGSVTEGFANAIRLHQDADIHPDHERVMIDHRTQWINRVPMRRTMAWWQRPHIASTDFYRQFLDEHFHPDSRTMIEDRLYGIMWVDCVTNRRNWDRWKVWVYTPTEGTFRRSGHLNGRGDEPKYDMDFGPREDDLL